MSANLASFEAFVRAYQDMVFTTAVRLTGDAATAEDLAQETFLKAWRQFDQLRDSPQAGGWLKTVVRRLALNHLTRDRFRWRFFGDAAAGTSTDGGEIEADAAEAALLRQADPSQQGPTQPVAPDVASLDQERAAHVERALRALPAKQRLPLVLYHFEDMSYEDIARHLKVSLAKVKTDIARGREALRTILGPQLENGYV